MNRQQKNTLILALVLLALLAAAFAVWRSGLLAPAQSGGTASDGENTPPAPGLYAEVTKQGMAYAMLPLDEDAELPVEDGELGYYNIVVVQDGRACVQDANCGDLTCVRTGWIGSPGEMIACLPHAVLVTVVEVTE